MATELNRVVTELIIDARGSVSGAAQHVRASKEAELATNKLSDTEEKARIAREKGVASFTGVSASISRVRSEYTNLQAKMDPVFAAQIRQQKELERAVLVTDAAVRRGVTTEQQAAATISRLRNQQIADLQRVKDATQDVIRVRSAANSNVRGANFATSNIAAQFQDIGVTAAMGMSPLQIALQQGTQLQAVLGPMGAAGAVKALGSAFMSLINPVSLVTLGLVAGTAALIQYFMTGEKESKSLDTALEAHAETIRALKDAYGEAAGGLQDYVKQSRVVADALAIIDAGRLESELKKTTDALVSSGAVVESEAQRIQRQIQDMMQAFEMEGDAGKRLEIDKQITALFQRLEGADTVARSAASGFEPLSQALERFAESARRSAPDYIKLKEEVSKQLVLQPTNDALRDLAARLFEVIDPGVKLQSAMDSTAKGIKLAGDQARASAADVGAFNDAINTLLGIAAPALSEIEQADKAMREGLEAAGANFLERMAVLQAHAIAMDRIRNKIAGGEVPIPTPRPNDIEMWDEAGAALDKVAAKVEQFRNRADAIGAKMFPGEYARREAQELLGLLDEYGDKLDDMQRKAVETRIDKMFVAASIGVRELGSETDRTGDKLGDLKDKGTEAGEALQDGFAGFLEDLFTGRDLLDSIISLGARLASMNFDNVAEGFSNFLGGKGFTLDAPSSGPASKANVVSFGKIVGVEVGNAVAGKIKGVSEGPIWERQGRGGLASPLQTGTALGQAVAPVLSKTLSPIGVEITKAADQLGVSARDLGTLISYESAGSFSTKKWGGKNNDYLGLIQFGPEEREKFGAYWGQAFGDQMQAAVKFFKARGLQPGMGIRDLYSTILTGSPGNYNRSDGYGTVDQHLTRMAGHQANADRVLAGLPEAVGDAAKDGTKQGSVQGIPIGIKNAAVAGATGGGMQVAGGMLSAGLGGFSTGYQAANPLMGALGGGVQGFGAGMSMMSMLPALGMALPVIGAVVGAVGGLIGGILGARNKVKQARRELEKQMNAINDLLAIGFGKGMGAFQKRLSEYLAEVDKAIPLAWKAKDWDLVDELHQSWNSMFLRLRKDFYDTFDESIAAYESGFGLESPVMKGAKALGDLREELRNMVADVRYFGEKTIEKTGGETGPQYQAYLDVLNHTVAQAEEASKKMILAFIGGRKEFTEYESAVMTVKGAIDVAQTALEELGMSARAAAEALDKQLNAALAKLRSTLIDDLSRSLYELSDTEYMGDLIDAQTRYNARLRDLSAVGLSADLANRELALSLRNIVKEAKLTDDQIRQLAAAMPELSGSLMGLLGMAEGGDTGQALADAQAKVEEAKSALRSAYEKERSELEATISRLKSFTEGIKSFRDSLRLDKQLSPLSPYERLMEAQRQFNDVSAKALGGDETAQGRLEEVSRAYLEEARSYYASSEAYFQIFEQVESILDQALAKAEGQLSNAEKQLSALEKQVGKLIDIDDGVKSVGAAIKELQAAQAAETTAKAADDAYKNSVFAEMLAVLKAQLAAQQAATAAQQAAASASTANYSSTDPVANSLKKYIGPNVDKASYDYYTGVLNSGQATAAQIDADIRQHAQNAVADMFRTILKKDPYAAGSGFDYYSNIVATGKASLADIEKDLKKHAAAAGIGMADGGWVTGGTPGMDSVLRMLMPKEFVMPAQQAQRFAPQLEAMRGGWFSGANDNSAVVGAIRDMQRQFADMMQRLIQIEATSGRENVQATRETTQAMRDQARNEEFRSRQKQKAA